MMFTVGVIGNETLERDVVLNFSTTNGSTLSRHILFNTLR